MNKVSNFLMVSALSIEKRAR